MPKSETVITYTKQEIEDLVRADVRKNGNSGPSTMEIDLYGTINNVNGGNLAASLNELSVRVTITDMKPVKKSA